MRRKILVLFVVCALFVSAALFARKNSGEAERVRVRLGDGEFVVRVADDADERMRGLGGVDTLALNEGMFFMFLTDDVHAMWMKDMHIPLDILWLSEAGVVVDKREDVSPDSFPQIFTPRTSARFVVELPAGSARMFDINIGSRAEIFSK